MFLLFFFFRFFFLPPKFRLQIFLRPPPMRRTGSGEPRLLSPPRLIPSAPSFLPPPHPHPAKGNLDSPRMGCTLQGRLHSFHVTSLGSPPKIALPFFTWVFFSFLGRACFFPRHFDAARRGDDALINTGRALLSLFFSFYVSFLIVHVQVLLLRRYDLVPPRNRTVFGSILVPLTKKCFFSLFIFPLFLLVLSADRGCSQGFGTETPFPTSNSTAF